MCGFDSHPRYICRADFRMYHVYLLRSLKNTNKSYVGLTIKPLKVRLKEHNDGLSTYTKTDKPWEIIYFENFYCKLCADKREQFLKSGFGYKFRQLMLKHNKELGKKSSSLKNGD